LIYILKKAIHKLNKNQEIFKNIQDYDIIICIIYLLLLYLMNKLLTNVLFMDLEMDLSFDLVLCNITDIIGNKYIGLDIQKSNIEEILDLWEDSFPNKNIYIDMKSNKYSRDKGNYHITVINVMEVNKLIEQDSDNRNKLNDLLGKVVNVELKGIGSAVDEKRGNEAHFIVADSPELDEVRESFGLGNQDFHITIGFDKKDVFGKSKAEDSIFIRF
jgi:hypothetical protein